MAAAAAPPAPRELPPPSFPAGLPTVPPGSVHQLPGIDGSSPPEAILKQSWEALVAHGVHRSEAMVSALTSFWCPDGAQTRDARGVYQWGLCETGAASEEVSRGLSEVAHLRASLDSATAGLQEAMSRAGFLHYVMRTAQHTDPNLEAVGPEPEGGC